MSGNKLKEMRNRAGYSQKYVANYLNVSKSSVSLWESGKVSPSNDTLYTMSKLYGVTMENLLGYGDIVPIDSSQNISKDTALIPIVGFVKAGWDGTAEQNISGYYEIEASLQKRFGNLFALSIYGDSMEPEIFEGDIVICQHCETVENNTLAIVCINGDIGTIKRVKRNKDCLELIPANPKYKPIKYTAEQVQSLPITICGEVVEVRRKYK